MTKLFICVTVTGIFVDHLLIDLTEEQRDFLSTEHILRPPPPALPSPTNLFHPLLLRSFQSKDIRKAFQLNPSKCHINSVLKLYPAKSLFTRFIKQDDLPGDRSLTVHNFFTDWAVGDSEILSTIVRYYQPQHNDSDSLVCKNTCYQLTILLPRHMHKELKTV